MQSIKLSDNKNTENKLSKQVKMFLAEQGFSHVWNKNEFRYHKKLTKKYFKPAQAIANALILESSATSDFECYAS
jgi:N-formylglutamate amidohydrolase